MMAFKLPYKPTLTKTALGPPALGQRHRLARDAHLAEKQALSKNRMTNGMATQAEAGWALVLAAAQASRSGLAQALPGPYAFDDSGQLASCPLGDSRAVLDWIPGAGWVSRLPADDPRSPLLDLYLPIASSHADTPMTVGHLGQSLDGFIATATGDSYYVTGEENVRHLHRMRALCDAVIVGAGTIAADDPQLTTRRVPGPNPLRVVLDRTRRLDDQYGVFNDAQAPTLLVCGDSSKPAWPASEQVEILRLPTPGGELELAALVAALRARGCARIFVEGGGVTVSGFLKAGLLDRLQLAVAPIVIGNGRPAIRLPGAEVLTDCLRPAHRIFRMGDDILFDCVLGPDSGAPAIQADSDRATTIARIL
jgi:diaminohydroxyphosphoribosylaminopyrimidine deaminase / 5-amino-6-(5-phosphoribosylamino)uracil reductase